MENDARRYVVALKQCLRDERAFVRAISDINPVANIEGRSDFEYKLLQYCQLINSDSPKVI